MEQADPAPFPLPSELGYIDLTLPTAAENLALDEALLNATHAGELPATLRLWELDHYAVILGRANRVTANVNVDACQRNSIPVLRRCTGGGTVLIGPGCLCFSLILPVSGVRPNISVATAELLKPLVEELSTDADSAFTIAGTSDIVAGQLKFSGNAQRWLSKAMIHHGTLLYDFDLPLISTYLTAPEREPDYREGRSHDRFVRNLPTTKTQLETHLQRAYNAQATEIAAPFTQVQELVKSRYSKDEWTFSR
ncbi:lipoate--protein ligase family protein [Calycomorphotria hydatis]|uniref:Putative lipoate-protein ligase A n=1 Tax=Calycomorphotria hydatis TaxID=2528027 RepID=A0A517T4S7_9PLAN|nr:lipoate--protein ligase family protein [Calycomorphotria hydatis]QDT63386.1 putative lipoate-protein ligase A [Calycomorphotria hydatis]